MKLEFNERGSKEFYDEILFVNANYYKILKNKNKKINRLTISFIKYLIISIIFTCLTIFLYLRTNDSFYTFVIGIYIILILFCIYFIIITNKRIKELISREEKITINITENYIEYKSVNSIFKINFEDVACILINKYSICFVPKTTKNAMISITSNYKDQIIKLLKKYKKESLLNKKYEK